MKPALNRLGAFAPIARILAEERNIAIETLLSDLKSDDISPIKSVIKSGGISGKEVAEILASYYGLDVIRPKELKGEQLEIVRRMLPEKLKRDKLVLPFDVKNGMLHVAVADPSSEILIQEIHLQCGMPIALYVGPADEIEHVLDKIFGARDFVKEIAGEDASEVDGSALLEESGEVLDLNKKIPEGKDTKVLRIVNHILEDAVRARASDIHLEPFAEEVKIRFRIDGVLHEITPPPKAIFQAIVSRFKILSKMDIAEKRIPQDGAFTLRLGDKEIDVRVSCLPVVWGEKICMRLLNKGAIDMDLAKLGLSERQYNDFISGVEAENGLVLVTGPTGSGKSTTLYSVLNMLKSPEVNISTVEDPVEYKLTGINQVQVKPQVGLTFASGLRAFLRQDPDILLVGEVRDNETANICMKAALTGHLVLTTLHTNDALSSVIRLSDMGIERFLIASTLRVVEAQRLIRKLCPECKEPYEADDATAKKYGFEAGVTLYKAKGCAVCNGLGYKGRIGIFEVVKITPVLREKIMNGASLMELKEEAEKEGMHGLIKSGIQKVLDGVTSLEEVAAMGLE